MAHRKFEAINKYNILGIEYVRLDELMALITEMQKKHREGTEPGYMCDDKGKQVAADLALNHLKVVLNKEKIHVQTIERVLKTRFEREAKEKAEEVGKKVAQAKETVDRAVEVMEKDIEEDLSDKHCPARYTVWNGVEDQETTENAWGFVEWQNGRAVCSHRPCEVMWFVDKGMAEKTAEKLGEGWEVVDMWPVMTKEQRLLRAIFSDDGEDDDEETESDF